MKSNILVGAFCIAALSCSLHAFANPKAPATTKTVPTKAAPAVVADAGLIAEGKVTLAKTLTDKAKGIRTLFISVYDAASTMPMPYGASKAEITKDAAGEFYTFKITRDNLMIMAGEATPPTKINLKFKLDKDGGAGRDAPGDLVGEVKGVQWGSKGIAVAIDKAF